MNYAEHLRQEIGSAAAWSMPVYFRVRLRRTYKNQYGTTYAFEDGSKAFVPAGSALIRVSETKPPRPRYTVSTVMRRVRR